MGIHAAAIPKLNEMVDETVHRMRRYERPGRYILDIARGVASASGYQEEDLDWISKKIHSEVSRRSGISQRGKKRGPRRKSEPKPAFTKTPTLEELEHLWAESDRHNPIYGVPGHQLKLAV